MSEIFGDEVGDALGGFEDELGRISDLGTHVSRTIRQGFHDAITQGQSLKTLLADIGRAFSDIALKAALKPVGDLAGGLVETLFAKFNPALSGVTPFAKGGVVSRPNYFPMGSGWGVAGEAGSEAILPLRRDSAGRLGVSNEGGGMPAITVNIATQDARSFAAAEAEVSATLLRAVRRGTRGA